MNTTPNSTEVREIVRMAIYEGLGWFGALPEPQGDVPERYHRWDDLGELADRILAALKPEPAADVGAVERAALNNICEMMQQHVDNWPNPKKLTTAIALIDKTLKAAIAAMQAATAPAAPVGDGLVERLNLLIEKRKAFVAAREAMNAARPDLEATPAERALYDERYKTDHLAERALLTEALDFATWASDTDVAACIEALKGEVERLRKLDQEYGRVEAAIIFADHSFDGSSDHPDCETRLIASVHSLRDRAEAAEAALAAAKVAGWNEAIEAGAR